MDKWIYETSREARVRHVSMKHRIWHRKALKFYGRKARLFSRRSPGMYLTIWRKIKQAPYLKRFQMNKAFKCERQNIKCQGTKQNIFVVQG